MTPLILSTEEAARLSGSGPSPADIRENNCAKIDSLHRTALSVYKRDNLMQRDLPLIQVVETVLYNFDATNRAAVARALSMTDDELLTLLTGFVLGYETSQASPHEEENPYILHGAELERTEMWRKRGYK